MFSTCHHHHHLVTVNSKNTEKEQAGQYRTMVQLDTAVQKGSFQHLDRKKYYEKQ